VSPAGPAVVVFTHHAEQRALERGISLTEVADAVLAGHDRRARNPGDADWLLRGRGMAIAYDWPDGDDSATAVVISLWRE
jgi:hypothetical protein